MAPRELEIEFHRHCLDHRIAKKLLKHFVWDLTRIIDVSVYLTGLSSDLHSAHLSWCS